MHTLSRWALAFGLFPMAGANAQNAQHPSGTQDEIVAAPLPLGMEDSSYVEPDSQSGEKVPAEAINLKGVEGWDKVFEREALISAAQAGPRIPHRKQGTWVVPIRDLSLMARSGSRLVCNKWGDTSMGIRFDGPVDLAGAWFAGMGSEGSWSPAIRAIGYRDGEATRTTDWFDDVDESMSFFAMNLSGIDRVVIESRVAVNGAGFFSLDDLTFTSADGVETVVSFEDAEFGTALSGRLHEGLTWELGTGDFRAPAAAGTKPPGLPQIIPFPLASSFGGNGTTPFLIQEFAGPRQGDLGASSFPPDNVGAAGTTHFVAAVNSNLSVYDKATGARLINSSLAAFLNSPAVGDPRVVFDPDSQRWIILATDRISRIYVAVSTSDDATGNFFRFDFLTSGGSDAGSFPDYPTLGVDARGIYTALTQVGGPPRMTLFTIDKAPLLTANPSMGTLTAFRDLEFDGAIQPAVHYEDPGFAHIISTDGVDSLRLRRLRPPLTAPTLVTAGILFVGTHTNPPNAPALGSTTALDTGDARLQNAVYRNGSIWTAQTLATGQGRTAARWFEVDPADLLFPAQEGVVADLENFYFYPTIAVNSAGDVVLGMSGSSPTMFAGAWLTGRLASDPISQTSVPFEFAPGKGPYNNLDAFGRNRWGDYSLTSVDPIDDTFWTIQEHAGPNNTWETQIAQLTFFTPIITNYCVSTPNSFSLGGAEISSSGSASVISNDLTLLVDSAPNNQFGLFFFGTSQIQTPIGNGFLCVGGDLFRFSTVQTTSMGTASFLLDNRNLPFGAPSFAPGQTANFQFWFRDAAGGGAGFNFSNALAVTFEP